MSSWRQVLIVCTACAGWLLCFPAVSLGAHYYLALGDSLAAGFQAPPTQPNAGYVDDLYAQRRKRQRDLRLVNIACLGTSSATLMTGDLCTSAAGPQLRHAVTFLRAHRRAINLVTIDIGGNDIGAACGTGTSVALTCVNSTLSRTRANVTKIAKALRAAAGPRTPILAMNYYDPALSWWLQGAALRALVPQSLRIVDSLNRTLADAYGSAGIGVADVAGAFAIHDLRDLTTLPGHGRVPVAVANICRYTGVCQQPQNPHGTPQGYRVISRAFLAVLAAIVRPHRAR